MTTELQPDRDSPTSPVPPEVEFEILKILHSFYIGKPEPGDKEYVESRRQQEYSTSFQNSHLLRRAEKVAPRLTHYVINMNELFALLAEKRGFTALSSSFHDVYMPSLMQRGLVVPIKTQYNADWMKVLLARRSFTGLDFPIDISEKGVALYRKYVAEQLPGFPHKLPRGTKWENFIIQFVDEDTVDILVRGIRHRARYEEMGFAKKGRAGNLQPDAQWDFFHVLAKHYGELKPKDPAAKPTYKKTKELLSEQLQNYFRIGFDPFYPYEEARAYKVRMILGTPDEKSVYETRTEDDPLFGIEEVFTKQ